MLTDLASRANLLAKTYTYSGSSGVGWGVGATIFWMFSSLASYVFSALALMFIAKKTKTPNAWMAWVPFLNLYLMCKAAGKSGLWIILLLIPFVNIIGIVLIWAAIAERLGKPMWWGILMLVPIANLVIVAILAFSGNKEVDRVIKKAAKVVSFGSGGSTNSDYKCVKCGAGADANDKFCPECGGKVAKKKEQSTGGGKGFCPECGAKSGSGKFCQGCGGKL